MCLKMQISAQFYLGLVLSGATFTTEATRDDGGEHLSGQGKVALSGATFTTEATMDDGDEHLPGQGKVALPGVTFTTEAATEDGEEQLPGKAFPAPPSNLRLYEITATSVKIRFNDYLGDDSYYVIQYKNMIINQDCTDIPTIKEKIYDSKKSLNKNMNENQDCLEISDIKSNLFYTVMGLQPSTRYEFRVLTENKIGRGLPSEPSYITTADSCGGEYNTASGIIRHPLRSYQTPDRQNCTWIIRAFNPIHFTFLSFVDGMGSDYLFIRDGESIQSSILGSFGTGKGYDDEPRSIQTSKNAAHIFYEYYYYRCFELYWEPAVEVFYQVLLHSDYEIKLNFSANSQPTAHNWYLGANFQEMPNIIQIPSDNRKFSTSLIDLENGNYQAVLRIAGITEEDLKTKFKLYVANEISVSYYRAILSEFPHPPSSLQISDAMPTSVWIKWDYNDNPGDDSYYVIQYKNRVANQDYTEISGIKTKFYTVRGLMPSTKYEFRVLAENKIGRGQPSEPSYITTDDSCGGEYNSSSGRIQQEKENQFNKNCTWIIRSSERINIIFVSFFLRQNSNLYVRDGCSIESKLVHTFSGAIVPRSIQTSSAAAHLLFTSTNDFHDWPKFDLHWEPAVETFYQALLKSDYEIKFNFSSNPRPTVLEWFYGANFQEMPNLIQVPSNNGKFSTFLIDLENDNYQAILRITGITGEDIETKFKLHVANEIGPMYYRIILSAFPHPLSNLEIKISDITATSVQIAWDYVNPGDISYYVIQYKPRNADQDYTEISDIFTKAYTVMDLMPTTEYEFHVLAVYKTGRGPPSEPSYVTTRCGGVYNSSRGMIHSKLNGGNQQDNQNCTWIIRSTERINITFTRFVEQTNSELYVRDGESIESNVLGKFSYFNKPSTVLTSTNAAHLLYTRDPRPRFDLDHWSNGFDLSWEPIVETFHQVLPQSDHEVRLNFSANTRPTTLKWSYGANFNTMPNLIQIPSDNEKFSTSLIDLGNGNYQALLKITRITEEDIETRFKLHVANEISEIYYRVKLSAFPHPPSSLQFSNITKTSVKITWSYNVNPGYISDYVIRYKPNNTNQDYTEISSSPIPMFYTVSGLMPSTEYEFQVLAANKIGRGTPSEPSYVTTGCGGEYNTSNGKIMFENNDNEDCTWIIRTEERIKISTYYFYAGYYEDFLTIRDGESIESNVLGTISKHMIYNDTASDWTVRTTTNRAYLHIKIHGSSRSQFQLHWEPLVETFYQLLPHSDNEIRFNFTASTQPTVLEWSYGANFQEMPNLIQIPSDNGKFSTSLIELENGNYQALLRISGVTEEDFETKFKLHVANEIGDIYYRVKLSAFLPPPLMLPITNIMPTSMQINWKDNINPEDILYYVIQYRTKNWNYTEISGIETNFYTVRDLALYDRDDLWYEFKVLAVNKFGRGPPSDLLMMRPTMEGCGGEYNTNSGMIHYPLYMCRPSRDETCIWIIRATGPINITCTGFSAGHGSESLWVRDGESIESNVLHMFSEDNVPSSVQTTTNAAYLILKSPGGAGFELHWESAV